MSDTKYQQHANIWKQVALQNPPWGPSDISTHCVAYMRYRADTEQNQAGGVERNSAQPT